ncbi:MAG: hypothetical protein GY953_33525, partial [bacterium]|nr:hypothetical protein [bacterium]
MTIMTRRVFLAGGALAPAAWGAAWDKKPYEKWSDDDVRRLLTDSPWAKSKKISLYFDRRPLRGVERWKDEPVAGTRTQPPGVAPDHGHGSPVGGIGAGKPKVPTAATLTVMWASAMP